MGSKFLKGPPVIRFQIMNKCSNRPFFRICLIQNNLETRDRYLEELGSFDPLPNKNNEMVVALNLERIRYYMGRGILVKPGVLQLLGIGLLAFLRNLNKKYSKF